MKQTKTAIILMSLALCAASCGSNPKQKNAAATTTSTAKADTAAVKSSYDVDSLLAVADALVNTTVSLRGYVTHTCKHSGKRCFLTDENQTASIRVEAKEGIGGFNRELVGSQIAVSGTLRERRISHGEVEELEKTVNKKQQEEDGSAESCQAELNNIAKMRKWMKEHGKDYYAIYYVDGHEYEVLD
jgi:hypothetical protein